MGIILVCNIITEVTSVTLPCYIGEKQISRSCFAQGEGITIRVLVLGDRDHVTHPIVYLP